MATVTDPWSLASPRLRWLLAPVALVLLALAAHLNAVPGGFVLDDLATVAPVARLVDEGRLGEAFTRPSWRLPDGALVYRPLTVLSYAWDYRWWGQNPFGYHQTNLWLHALAVVLVYGLIVCASGRRALALAVAALFAAHPVTTHCVAHIANRGPLLATTGLLGALWLFAVAGRWSDIRQRLLLALATVAGVLSLLAAVSALAWPVLAALYLLAAEPQADRRRWQWVGVFAGLTATFFVVRLVVLGGWGEPTTPAALGVGDRLLATLRAVGISVASLVWPSQLQLFHPLQAGTWLWRLLDYAVGLLVLGAAAVVVWRARRAAPAIWLGQFWVLVGMVPVWIYAGWTGTLTEQWLYLPLPGMLLVACGMAARMAQRVEFIRLSPRTVALGATLLVAVLAAGARRFNHQWRNDRLLLAQRVALAPDALGARLQYARSLVAAGQRDEAIAQYRRVLEAAPRAAAVHSELGVELAAAGQADAALEHFRRAVWLEPGQAQWQYHLGIALEQRRDYAAAIAHYRLAVAGTGAAPHVFNNLAWLLATAPHASLRNGTQAVEFARQAAQLLGEPDVNYLDTLAAALAETGNFHEAAKVAQQAVQLATGRGETELAAAVRGRLKLYLDRQPYRLER